MDKNETAREIEQIAERIEKLESKLISGNMMIRQGFLQAAADLYDVASKVRRAR